VDPNRGDNGLLLKIRGHQPAANLHELCEHDLDRGAGLARPDDLEGTACAVLADREKCEAASGVSLGLNPEAAVLRGLRPSDGLG
jgi:hypothetical protein